MRLAAVEIWEDGTGLLAIGIGKDGMGLSAVEI